MLFGTRNTILDLVFLNFENNVSYIAMSSRLKMTWIIGHYHKRLLLGTNCFFYGIISILLLHERRKTIPSTGFKKFSNYVKLQCNDIRRMPYWRQMISKCSGSLRQYMIHCIVVLYVMILHCNDMTSNWIQKWKNVFRRTKYDISIIISSVLYSTSTTSIFSITFYFSFSDVIAL